MPSTFSVFLCVFILLDLAHFATSVTIQIATFADADPLHSESVVKSTDPINTTNTITINQNNNKNKNINNNPPVTPNIFDGLTKMDHEKLAQLLESLRGKCTQESAKTLKEMAKKASEPFKVKRINYLKRED